VYDGFVIAGRCAERGRTLKTVLIVDDEVGFLRSVADGFSGCSKFRCVTAHNGKEALRVLETVEVDLMVTDLVMPEMDGFELIGIMKKDYPSVPVIVISAYLDNEVESGLRALGIDHYLEKPLDFEELTSAIKDKVSSASGDQSEEVLVP
jgi:YesN/AraC family two-component response regulator